MSGPSERKPRCVQQGGSESKKITFEVRGWIFKEKILAKEAQCNKSLMPGGHPAPTGARLQVYEEMLRVFLTRVFKQLL